MATDNSTTTTAAAADGAACGDGVMPSTNGTLALAIAAIKRLYEQNDADVMRKAWAVVLADEVPHIQALASQMGVTHG